MVANFDFAIFYFVFEEYRHTCDKTKFVQRKMIIANDLIERGPT